MAPVASEVAPVVDALTAPLAVVVTPVVQAAEPVHEVAARVGDAVLPVVEPVERVVSPVVEDVEQVASPVVEPVEQVASPVVEDVEQVASPVVEPVEQVASPVVEPVEQVASPVVEPVEQVASPVAESAVPPAAAPDSPRAPRLQDQRDIDAQRTTEGLVASPDGTGRPVDVLAPGLRDVRPAAGSHGPGSDPLPVRPAMPVAGGPAGARCAGTYSSDQPAADLPAAVVVATTAALAVARGAREAADGIASDPSFSPD